MSSAKKCMLRHATPQANPRMQPTGRKGAELRSGGALLERDKERRCVRARARWPAADAQVVRRTRYPGDIGLVIRPFTIDVPPAAVSELKRRLDNLRWQRG
jgi:hypothetical protein